MKKQVVKLDLTPNSIAAPTLRVKQFDYGERAFQFDIYDQGTEYKIPSGTLVAFQGTKPDKNGISVTCTFSGNSVLCNCTQQMTAVSGLYRAELRFRFPDGSVGSADFYVAVAEAGITDGTKISESEISGIKDVVDAAQQVEKFKSQSEAAATRAEDAADDAAKSQQLAAQASSALRSASMKIAASSADMSDTNLIYLYVGDEDGFVNNNWYYYRDGAWQSGGTFGSANTALIVDKAVTESKLAKDAVTTEKIHDEAVTADKLAADAVTTDKIKNVAVTEDKLAFDAVTEHKIKDGSVTSAKLAKDAVNANSIQNGTITVDKLAPGFHLDLNKDEVTTDKIADKAVTADKLAEDVRQVIIDSSATQVVDALPTEGKEKVDYILKANNGCLYYKWFDNAWHMVAGSLAVIVDTLPETTDANEYTDYYVPNAAGAYLHYRFKDGAFHQIGSDSYSKTEIDQKIKTVTDSVSQMSDSISQNSNSIGSLSEDVSKLTQELNEKGDGHTYNITITQKENDDGSTTYYLNLFEDDGESPITSIALPATGGGGQTSTTEITIKRITPTPYILTVEQTPTIRINFSDVDKDGETVNATYVWYSVDASNRRTQILSGSLTQGENSYDLSQFVSVGTQRFLLAVTDEAGSSQTKSWEVRMVDIRLESNFNDRYSNAIGDSVNFTYTPYGAVSKTVHFKLDGTQLDSVTTTSSGVTMTKTIPAQPHGAHMLETWITAQVDNNEIETKPHIFKDLVWYDTAITGEAVISCEYRSEYYGTVAAKQYDTTAIVYNVFDPTTNFPKVEWYEDGLLKNTSTLQQSQDTWNYQTDVIGQHILKIVCRNTTITIVVDVSELGIDVDPITQGLEIDFNPTGKTNASADRIWSNSKYKMTVSDNFDWSNGGYKTDDNGDTYFLIKAGTNISLNYYMFPESLTSNPSTRGAEMKVIFMTENVQDADAVWLTNTETTTNTTTGAKSYMGIQMSAHSGWLKTNTASDTTTSEGEAATNTYLYMPYSEEDIIEMDIDIDAIDRDGSQQNAFAMSYEDGTPSKAFVYNNTDRFYQYTPQPVVIGSDSCDVRIYRLKFYSTSLTTEGIMKNFIADARSATEKIGRYNRNSIYYNRETGEYTPYSGQGILDPERLAPRIPNVKVLMLETDHFTASKNDFIPSTLRCIHASGGDVYEGDPYYDNWLFENGYHAGQGTTSDRYGDSSRNVDFLFNCDGVHKPSNKVDVKAGYISKLTLGYNTENAHTQTCEDWEGDSAKITLTRTSVPNNFFNFKANVASSENVNNALLQKRYNDFLPYAPNVTTRNQFAKNSMEFVPAVLFIKETAPDINSHTEFLDNEWHFYSLGNLGDSKKTDYTRAYDPSDRNEFTIEISDNTPNNAQFQTGVYLDEQGNRQIEHWTTVKDDKGNISYEPVVKGMKQVYPITEAEWNDENNMRHFTLYNEAFDGDHSFEPRYAACGDYRDGKLVNDTGNGGKDQVKINNDVWRAFYRWVVTSTDDEFKSQLDEWCARSAVQYFYAFTSTWLMMDNRAKNTFWHYAKSGTMRKMSKPVKELLHVYQEKQGDDSYKPTTDTQIDPKKEYYCEYVFDLSDYDNDTALGINNNGELIFPYGTEDTDYQVRDNPGSGWAFNGALSTFWCRLRNLCGDEIRTIFSSVDVKTWSAENLITQFDQFQQCYPEEIWRLDVQRKYIRIFNGTSIDNSKPRTAQDYLKRMMQGRKKYQRRQWVRNESVYYGSKELVESIVGGTNVITMRCFTPDTYTVAPNYDLTITPFQDMYVSVQFGNTNDSIRQARARAGIPVTLKCPFNTMTDTQVIIFAANSLSGLNDLSTAYVSTIDFGAATKLKKIVLGNETDGYSNPKLTSLAIGNNYLLEELDLRNCSGLSGSLDFTRCSNLLRLYAEGTRINGVIFANNGKIEIAHLPDTINTLTMRNLNSLSDFQCNFDSLETLTMEGGKINGIDGSTTYTLTTAEDTVDTLRRLNMYSINWTLGETTLLNQIARLFSSSLTGKVYVSGAIRQQELNTYTGKWPDLKVTYDGDKLVTQYKVTFVNADGSELWTEWIDRGSLPTDPVESGDIPTPTRTSDAEYDYKYKGWDNMEIVVAPRNIVAQYDTTIRKYRVTWWQRTGVKLAEIAEAPYGTEVVYPNDLPTNTSEEGGLTYNIFQGWDKSTGFIKGDTDVYAVWDTKTTPPAGTELKDMSPAQIYAVSMQGKGSDYFTDKDYFDITLGHDYTFSNVTSKVLCENRYFNGKNDYLDTNIRPLDEDAPSFTLAIDYEMSSNNTSASAALVSCFKTVEKTTKGILITSSSGSPKLQWGNTSQDIGVKNQRSIIVMRHTKGSNDLVLYVSNQIPNRYSDDVQTITKTSDKDNTVSLPLTFGATLFEDGGHDNYAEGWIYWAKYWEEDLGADVAKSLASWPHEKLRMEFAGVNRDRIGNTSQRANLSFVANNLLNLCHAMNNPSTNVGGWDTSAMKKFLNEKFYNALEPQWQGIIRTVQVQTNSGDSSEVTIPTENKIYIPSVHEVNAQNNNVYANEGEPISFFTNARSRLKYLGLIIPEDSHSFPASNTDPSNNASNGVKEGDTWITGNTGYYYISKDTMNKHAGWPMAGYTQNNKITDDGNGMWIQAAAWWTRSAEYNGSTNQNFMAITNRGGYGTYSADNTIGILVAFSV